MNLPTIDDIDVKGKSVFVRASLDVPLENGYIKDTTRLEASLATLFKLRDAGAKRIYIAGHLGRPNGDFDPNLSSKNLIEWYKQALEEDVYYVPFMHYEALHSCPMVFQHEPHRFYLMENLRFWEEEERSDIHFIDALDTLAEVYINDAFDVSHREHASIIGIPHMGDICAFGESFVNEYAHLSKVLENPVTPVVTILSGVKEDKLDYLDRLTEISDMVLVAGKLPTYLEEDFEKDKVFVSRLIQDKEDITLHSVEKFEAELARAGTIVVSGPVGRFEDEGHRQGTERVFKAVAMNENAFKLAGGGDTNAAIDMFNLREQFNWVSIAGGAMLDFLADGTLPGIEAIVNR